MRRQPAARRREAPARSFQAEKRAPPARTSVPPALIMTATATRNGGSAISPGSGRSDLPSWAAVYRRHQGDDDAVHGHRALPAGLRPDDLPPLARRRALHAGGADLRRQLDRSEPQPLLAAHGVRRSP